MDALRALWVARVASHGGDSALRVLGGADWSYADVDARARALAARLGACGAGRGGAALAVDLDVGGLDVIACVGFLLAGTVWCPCDTFGVGGLAAIVAPAAAVARSADARALAALEAVRSEAVVLLLTAAGGVVAVDDGLPPPRPAAPWPADALYVLATSSRPASLLTKRETGPSFFS